MEKGGQHGCTCNPVHLPPSRDHHVKIKSAALVQSAHPFPLRRPFRHRSSFFSTNVETSTVAVSRQKPPEEALLNSPAFCRFAQQSSSAAQKALNEAGTGGRGTCGRWRGGRRTGRTGAKGSSNSCQAESWFLKILGFLSRELETDGVE